MTLRHVDFGTGRLVPITDMTEEEVSERYVCAVDVEETEALIEAAPEVDVSESKDPPRIAKLRKIVAECQAAKVEGKMIDGYSASMAVQVWDAINEANREKLLAMPVVKMVSVMWTAVGKQKARK